MLLLVTKAHPTIMAWRHPNLGRLAVPRDHARMDETAAAGIPWAADNAAFSGFDEPVFRRMLATLAGVSGCRFVVAPDVVADADATFERFLDWVDPIRAAGLPVGFAAQDGLEYLPVPWDAIDALFIGGSTRWKLSDQAARLVAEANGRGKWTHMGRVNSLQRVEHAAAIGCDSVDGSKFSRFTDTWLPGGLAAVGAPSQLRLDGIGA